MLKKLVTLAVIVAFTGSAQAATYVVLPSPGSMAPATIIIDEAGPQNHIFICSSLTEITTGACRLHRKAPR
jgi:hypothetical protein